MQPRISYRIAERDVTAELYQVLPRWLFEMVLLLQNNNVQMAITKSAQHAPAVLGERTCGALREKWTSVRINYRHTRTFAKV